MYCVKKVLNNNAVLAIDFKEKKEVVFMGKGVGFNSKVNQPFEWSDKAIKKYRLEKETEKGDTQKLLDTVDPFYVEIAGKIIDLAEETFGPNSINSNILLPLADHIAFSIYRAQNNIQMENPFFEDIRLLYAEEYKVAQQAKAMTETFTGYFIPDTELAYISLYIHSGLENTSVSQAIRIPEIMAASVDRIKEECNIEEIDQFSYNRLFYHIKCMLGRVNKNEKLNQEMLMFTREKCPNSFELATDICNHLGDALNTEFTEVEISFLALHIERIKSNYE